MISLDPITILSLLLGITTIIVFEVRYLKWAVYAYVFQTLLLVSIFSVIAYQHHFEPLYAWSITAFVTKVVLVPYVLWKLLDKVKIYVEDCPVAGIYTPFVAVAISLSVAILISPLFLKFALIKLPIPLTVSIAIFMMGILGFVFRRCAFKQILSFCLFENGIHLTLALTASSAPETVEIGILTDAIFAVIIMSVLAKRFYKYLGTWNTSKANSLKG